MRAKYLVGAHWGTGLDGKPLSFETALAPVTLFHGDNFSGKTQRLNALWFALAGYVPGVASKPRDIYERLCSADPLAAEVEFDDGTVLRRSLHGGSNGSVKSKVEGPGDFREHLLVPPETADPEGEFLSLSSAERVKFLFARAKLPEELSVKALKRRLAAAVKNTRVEKNTEGSEAAIEVVLAELDEVDGLAAQEWVEAVVLAVLEGKKGAAAALDRNRKARQEAEQLDERGTPVPPANSEQRRTEASKAASDASGKAAATERLLADVRAKWHEADKAKRQLPDESKVNERLAELEKELVKPNAPNPEPFDEEAHEKAMRFGMESEAAEKSAFDEIASLNKSIHSAQSEKVCPHCGQSVESLQKPILEKLKAQLDQATLRWGKACAVAKQARGVAKESREKRLRAFQAAEAAREDLKRRAVLRDEADSLRLKLSGSQELKRKAGELPALTERGKELANELSELKAKAQEAQNALAKADADYKRICQVRARAAERAKLSEESERCEVELEVWKAAQKEAASLQAELTGKGVGPLLERANSLCCGLLSHPLVWQDGEVGMEGPTGFWTWRSFSGTQRAAAYAALSVALATQAKLRIAVIDEVTRLDRSTDKRKRLVENLCRLVEAGDLDQAVLAGTEPIGHFGKSLYEEVKV